MANKRAIVRVGLQWTSGGGGIAREPAAGGVNSVQALYRDMEPDSVVVVPDTTVAATEYEIPFGSSAAATLLMVENNSGQAVKARVNAPASVEGTLVSGTKDLTLANVAGDRLVVLLKTSGGTPGILSVKRKSDTEVTVESWTTDGLQDADTSTVTVYNYADGYPFQLADDGKLIIVQPSLPSAGKITAAKVKTTTTQSGDGEVIGRVFGDPL